MAYEIKRFPYDGTIDADGHILEPPDLWESYLEAKFRPRALRIKLDADGFEYLEIDGRPSQRSRRGSLGLLGAMGEEDMTPRADRRYAENFPYGASERSSASTCSSARTSTARCSIPRSGCYGSASSATRS
jgi:hypothetical protein